MRTSPTSSATSGDEDLISARSVIRVSAPRESPYVRGPAGPKWRSQRQVTGPSSLGEALAWHQDVAVRSRLAHHLARFASFARKPASTLASRSERRLPRRARRAKAAYANYSPTTSFHRSRSATISFHRANSATEHADADSSETAPRAAFSFSAWPCAVRARRPDARPQCRALR